MDEVISTTRPDSRWKCDKCGKVLSGYFDGDEYKTKTLNGQEIVIKNFGAAKLEAICQDCNHKNVFDGKRFYADDHRDEIYGLYPELK